MAKKIENSFGSEEYVPDEQPGANESFARRIVGACRKYCASPWKIWKWTGILVLAALVWLILGNFGLIPSGDFPAVSGSKWQAVFLTNGQVYFGHLDNYNRKYLRLQNVYYLQAAQPLQQGQQAPANLNLVKLGNELHGPEDTMFIPKDRVLFWENMKEDSQVAQGIESIRQ